MLKKMNEKGRKLSILLKILNISEYVSHSNYANMKTMGKGYIYSALYNYVHYNIMLYEAYLHSTVDTR